MEKENNENWLNNLSIPASEDFGNFDTGFYADDILKPKLRIGNSQSEVFTDPDKKIKGLELGDFYLTSEEHSLSSSVNVVPLIFFRTYQELTNEEKPSFIRYINEYEWNNYRPVRRSNSKYFDLPSGNLGQEVYNYDLVLVKAADDLISVRYTAGPGSFAMCKDWNSKITNVRAPMFFQVWKLKTFYNPSKDKKTAAFYALGKSSSFGGTFLGIVPKFLRTEFEQLHSAANSERKKSQNYFDTSKNQKLLESVATDKDFL